MLKRRGFTLLEMLVALAVLAVALAVATPAFGDWVRNGEVRSAAETLRASIRQARAEAMRRNASVRFRLTDANGTLAWSMGCVRANSLCPQVIRSEAATNSPLRVTVDNGLPAAATFDAHGSLVASGGTDFRCVALRHSGGAGVRTLVLRLGEAGMVKLDAGAGAACGA